MDRASVIAAAAAPGSTGSAIWQTALIVMAVLFLALEIVRGWNAGLARQAMRLGALLVGYLAAVFGGQLFLPILRPLFRFPDVVLSALGGGVLALLVYAAIVALGTFYFKRTDQQEGRSTRWLYGLSGGVLGLIFGLFTVWMVMVALRSLGSVAEAKVRALQPAPTPEPPPTRASAARLSRLAPPTPAPEAPGLFIALARLKNSLELGAVGDAVKGADVIPSSSYELLGRVGAVVSNPAGAERFLAFPGAHELSEHPKIVALRNDPEVAALVADGRFLELLQNPRVIEALNDPTLIKQVRKFDLQKALDYALGQQR